MKIIHPVFPSSIELSNKSLSLIQVNKSSNKDSIHATINISPLEPGLAQPLGHLLRKLLLRFSSGSAITSVWISGIKHELSPLPGVQEDLTHILHKISKISLGMDHFGPGRIYLRKENPGIVTTDDLIASPGIRIFSKSFYLFTLDVEGSVWMVFNVESGKGDFEGKNIRLLQSKKQFLDPLLDSKYNKNQHGVVLSVPHKFGAVLQSSYQIKHFTHYDELSLEIETNGSVSALESFESSCSFFLQKFLQIKLDSSLKV